MVNPSSPETASPASVKDQGSTNMLTGSGVDEAWATGTLLADAVVELLRADKPFMQQNLEATYETRRRASWVERDARGSKERAQRIPSRDYSRHGGNGAGRPLARTPRARRPHSIGAGADSPPFTAWARRRARKKRSNWHRLPVSEDAHSMMPCSQRAVGPTLNSTAACWLLNRMHC